MALLTSAAVHFALNRIREQRRRLQILIDASASLDRSLDPAETLRAISAHGGPRARAGVRRRRPRRDRLDRLDRRGRRRPRRWRGRSRGLAGGSLGPGLDALERPARRRARAASSTTPTVAPSDGRPDGRGATPTWWTGTSTPPSWSVAGYVLRGGLPDARARAHPRGHHLLAPRRPSGPSTGGC